MYTLYHSPGACSLAVKAALILTGAEFKTQLIDLSKGEHLSEEYKKIHPLSKVPALDTGEFILTEGMAMHLYLADQYPEAGLFPQSGRERAEAFRWMSYIYASVHPLFGLFFYPDRFSSNPDSTKAKAKELVFSHMAEVQKRLEKHDFLAGNSLSAADLYLTVQLHWALAISGDFLETHNTLAAFVKRIYDHSSVGVLYQEEFAR